MGISNLSGKHLKNVKHSVASDHLLECNCSIDFDNFDILASDANSHLNKTIKSFPLKLPTFFKATLSKS